MAASTFADSARSFASAINVTRIPPSAQPATPEEKEPEQAREEEAEGKDLVKEVEGGRVVFVGGFARVGMKITTHACVGVDMPTP